MVFFWNAFFATTLVLLVTVIHLINMRFGKQYQPTSQFSVAVIVPCKGDGDPDFKNNLLSIIRQEYGGASRFIFCAESEQDSAVPILRELTQQFDQVQLCIAGLSTRCAQKTYNILQGMAMVGETDIFLMADADIQPHTTWLQEMVAPFSDSQIAVTTGFFRRVPLTRQFHIGNYLVGLYSTIIAIGLSNKPAKGVWGGSLAIRKTVMDKYHLYERLATEIVDDMTIMHALHQHNLERFYVTSCTLKSYCHMSISDSLAWLMRQIQFSQIYFKVLYFFYYAVVIPYALSILAIPGLLVYGLLFDGTALWNGLAIWLMVTFSGGLIWLSIPVSPANHSPHDADYRLLPWLLITPLAMVCSALVLLQTQLRVKNGILTMHWRGIEYRVDVKTGKVLEIMR